MKKGEEEIGLRRKWGAKGDGSLKNFNQFYCCERSPGSCRGNLLGLKRSTIMIGFSLDIDLTAVFPRLSRHLPAYLATYEPVRRNIATETARDGRTEEHRALSATSWRLFKFKTGRDRSRAAVTASCSFILCLLFFTEARRARPFSLSRVSPPLIPGSCRSSPRPARPSKNSLTCLADSPSLYLSSDSANFLYVLCVERGKETTRRRGPGRRTDLQILSSSRCCLPLEDVKSRERALLQVLRSVCGRLGRDYVWANVGRKRKEQAAAFYVLMYRKATEEFSEEVCTGMGIASDERMVWRYVFVSTLDAMCLSKRSEDRIV